MTDESDCILPLQELTDDAFKNHEMHQSSSKYSWCYNNNQCSFTFYIKEKSLYCKQNHFNLQMSSRNALIKFRFFTTWMNRSQWLNNFLIWYTKLKLWISSRNYLDSCSIRRTSTQVKVHLNRYILIWS